MKTYLVTIDKRKGPSTSLGIFKTHQKAVEAIKKYLDKGYSKEAIEYCLDSFGGNIEKGEFYSEDETIEISENECKLKIRLE